MPIQKHLHKLKRHTYKTGVSVYFCVLDCNFKVETPFALGKEVLCNICDTPFIMNEYSIKLVRPHCQNCGRKEVKGPDGKKYYIRQVNTRVLADVAQDEVNNLREKLDKATSKTAVVVTDEDI